MTFLSRILHARPSRPDIHFHQGPQGQATPCYETACGSPRLQVEDR